MKNQLKNYMIYWFIFLSIAIYQEDEQCHNKTESKLREIPHESCDIIPEQICNPVTKQTPYLDPVPSCQQIPKVTELQRRSSKILPRQCPLSKRFLSSDARFIALPTLIDSLALPLKERMFLLKPKTFSFN